MQVEMMLLADTRFNINMDEKLVTLIAVQINTNKQNAF